MIPTVQTEFNSKDIFWHLRKTHSLKDSKSLNMSPVSEQVDDLTSRLELKYAVSGSYDSLPVSRNNYDLALVEVAGELHATETKSDSSPGTLIKETFHRVPASFHHIDEFLLDFIKVSKEAYNMPDFSKTSMAYASISDQFVSGELECFENPVLVVTEKSSEQFGTPKKTSTDYSFQVRAMFAKPVEYPELAGLDASEDQLLHTATGIFIDVTLSKAELVRGVHNDGEVKKQIRQSFIISPDARYSGM